MIRGRLGTHYFKPTRLQGETSPRFGTGLYFTNLTLQNSNIDIAMFSSLRTTVPFVTAHLEIFHCTHHPVILKSDLYFTFCSTLNALSKRTSK